MPMTQQEIAGLEERLAAYPVRSMTLHHGRLSYRDAGDGPLVVCLHGIGSGSGSWLHQFEEFTPAYRLVAWDAPGYGESDPLPTAEPLAADYADVAAAMIEELSSDRFVLIGHSLGALIGASYAARNTDRLRAMILASPARGYGHAEPEIRRQKWQERKDSIAALGPAGLAEQRSPAMLHDGASPEALALVRWNMRRLNADGYGAAAHALANGEILADAARWPGPAGVFCGADDPITPPQSCRAVADVLQNADYVETPDAGHALYVDQPAAFNCNLAKFLETLP